MTPVEFRILANKQYLMQFRVKSSEHSLWLMLSQMTLNKRQQRLLDETRAKWGKFVSVYYTRSTWCFTNSLQAKQQATRARLAQWGRLGLFLHCLCTVQVTALGVLSAPCTRRRTPVAFRRSSSVEVLLEDRSESGGSDGKIVWAGFKRWHWIMGLKIGNRAFFLFLSV